MINRSVRIVHFFLRMLFAGLLLCASSQAVRAQDADSSNVNLRVTLLNNDLVADVNFERQELVDWLQHLKTAIDQYFRNVKGDHELALIVTFAPDGRGEVQAAARPPVSDSMLVYTRSVLNSVPAPKPRISEYSVLLNLDLNKGNADTTLKFTPTILLPAERNRRLFQQMDLAAKHKAIKDYARKEALPLLAEIAVLADTSFVGLNSLGTRIKGAISGNFFRVDRLCNDNPDYWRGVTQLKSGNFLVPAIKVFCLAAEGRYDWANRHLFFMNIFADNSTVAGEFMRELSWRLTEYYTDLNAQITRGIGLTDTNNMQQAKSLYDSLLNIVTYSAWTEYERYYTQVKLQKETTGTSNDSLLWLKAQENIFKADALYPVRARVYSGRDAYLVSRRNQINALFQDPAKLYRDLFIYSDIALDVGEHAFAAELLWILLTNAPPRADIPSREILLIHYIYCLDQLGQKDVIAQFKGDYSKDIQQIAEERQKRMEASPLYQRFERKD